MSATTSTTTPDITLQQARDEIRAIVGDAVTISIGFSFWDRARPGHHETEFEYDATVHQGSKCDLFTSNTMRGVVEQIRAKLSTASIESLDEVQNQVNALAGEGNGAA